MTQRFLLSDVLAVRVHASVCVIGQPAARRQGGEECGRDVSPPKQGSLSAGQINCADCVREP